MQYTAHDIAAFKTIPLNFIVAETVGHVFTIVLNRPEKRNAFTPTMVNEIAFALAYAQSDNDIWCVVFEANGPVFCAGMDLAVFQDPALDKRNNALPQFNPALTFGEAFATLTKPCVAKVKGPVLAGGFLIICTCNFVIASNDSRFSLPEVKRGLFPMQVMALLLKIMPQRTAMQLCISAEELNAQKAKELGLVSAVADADTIDSDVDLLVARILENSPNAIAAGITAMKTLQGLPPAEVNNFLANQLAKLRSSADAQEGIDAFKEKRDPIWQNK